MMGNYHVRFGEGLLEKEFYYLASFLLYFLTIGEDAHEKEVEKELVKHISKFLTELGVGFAYMGQQYKISTHGDDYWLDLLFFHVKLNCFIVCELLCGAQHKT